MALPRSAELQPAAGHVGPAHDRVVRRIGTGIVKDVLTRKSELQGFKLVEVNPTYTSQACGSCCFISRANRRGNRFECVCCGKQAHTDAEAARNLVERFREGRTCEYVKQTTLGMQGLELWAARMRPPGEGNPWYLAAPGRRWRRPGGPA